MCLSQLVLTVCISTYSISTQLNTLHLLVGSYCMKQEMLCEY